MKKIFAVVAMASALTVGGAGAAQATETPVEPGYVTESGVVVGDNADLYGNEPVPINTDTPVPTYGQIPALTKAEVEAISEDVYGHYPAPAPIIEEDEPGWNCETMGNGVCGPAMDATPTEELADTGTGTTILAVVGAMVLGAGIGVVYISSRVRRRR